MIAAKYPYRLDSLGHEYDKFRSPRPDITSCMTSPNDARFVNNYASSFCGGYQTRPSLFTKQSHRNQRKSVDHTDRQ